MEAVTYCNCINNGSVIFLVFPSDFTSTHSEDNMLQMEVIRWLNKIWSGFGDRNGKKYRFEGTNEDILKLAMHFIAFIKPLAININTNTLKLFMTHGDMIWYVNLRIYV